VLITVAPAGVLMTAAPAGADDVPALYELVDAAAQRLQTADPVAAAKWLNGGAITDATRAEQVLAATVGVAETRGLADDFTRQVFTDQINANEAIQYARFAGWKLDTAAAPGWAPELAASRQIIDRLNRVIIDQLAVQQPLLQSPECGSALDAAESSVAAARQFDDLYRRALDSATRSYCQG